MDELTSRLLRSHNGGILFFIEDMTSESITEIPYLLDINTHWT